MDGGLLGFLWYVVMVFAFVAYLFILFYIFTDLFRDHQLNGWWKALWIVALIFVFPPFPALAYLIFRGRGMAERSQKAASQAIAAQQEYIKQVAGTSTPTDQIAQAQSLLDAGAITQDEFNQLKAKALS